MKHTAASDPVPHWDDINHGSASLDAAKGGEEMGRGIMEGIAAAVDHPDSFFRELQGDIDGLWFPPEYYWATNKDSQTDD